jgi:hypothetical protein
MCAVLLPPGVDPIAVNKYMISYHINNWLMNSPYVRACLVSTSDPVGWFSRNFVKTFIIRGHHYKVFPNFVQLGTTVTWRTHGTVKWERHLFFFFFFKFYVYVFIVCLCIHCMFMYLHRASWHSSPTLTEVFPCFFLSCKANARV